jgi:2,3-bisphosphoglycerate-independent phosphoglycerate mutase
VDAALTALETRDFVFLHVEAPDEAGHSGQLDLKVKAIEDFDEKITGPMLAGLQNFPHWRLMLMPDHCTPISLRKHTSDPVPFILLNSQEWAQSDKTAQIPYSEAAACATGFHVPDASKMIEMLFRGDAA